MSESEQTRQLNFVQAPFAGLVTALAVTTTVATQDLRKLDNQTYNGGDTNTSKVGAGFTYVSFLADGGDVYVAFAATAAPLASISPTATGVNGANVTWKIPSGSTLRLKLRSSQDANQVTNVDYFVGYVTSSGTATLRIYKSSPYAC